MKTKAEAKVPNKSTSAPMLEKQPERLEQQSGPLTIARITTAALPLRRGNPSVARAANVMRAPASLGIAGRARTMHTMQQSVGNTRLSRMLGAPVQAKLTVGAPGDAHEQEADQTAETVMRMPSPAAPAVQRCPACARALRRHPAAEGDEAGDLCPACARALRRRPPADDRNKAAVPAARVQRQATGAPPDVDPAVDSHISATRGGGEMIPDNARATMESRFGADFSEVRVHSDTHANQAAQALDAQAFTTGRDIYFGAGRYQPGAAQGQRLLAHELTHVVQQKGGRQQVQRAPRDFQVRGPFTPRAGEEARWSNFAFFDMGESTLAPAQRQKVDDFATTLAGTPDHPVTLVGFASEEGDPAFNARLVDGRIQTVAQILVGRGHSASAITRVARPAASRGQIAYRQWRAVEMLAGPAVSSVPDCSSMPQTTTFSLIQGVSFALAQSLGMQLLDNTAQRLRAAPVPAATLQLARRLFGPATPPDQIADRLDTIRTTLAAQTTGNTLLGTPCHKSCQGGTVAFVRGDTMTLCPAFFETADPFQQARVLVHESAHKQSGLDVRDRAYGWERLINLLGRVAPAQALNNADSFTLLVMFDNGLTSLPGSQAPTDDLSALPAADRDKAEVALAYLQRWLTATLQISNWLYNNVNDGISAGSWTNPHARTEMQFVAGQFGLDFLAARPRDRDRAAVAAIYDRYQIMARSLKTSLVVTASSGNTHWQPGPGNAVAVAPSLWSRNTPDQVRLLLNRLATATPDIRAGLVRSYVAVADRFRQFRGEGP